MFLPSNITLKFGDSGDFVAELQRRLAAVRAFADDQVNGFFDGNTVNAVTAFQGREGLHADGVAGPETLRRLNGIIAGDTSASSGGDTKEEEQANQLATAQEILQPPASEPLFDPTTLAPAAAASTHAPYGEEAHRAAQPQPVEPALHPALHAQQPMQPEPSTQQYQQLQRDQQLHAAPHPALAATAQSSPAALLDQLLAPAPQAVPQPTAAQPPALSPAELERHASLNQPPPAAASPSPVEPPVQPAATPAAEPTSLLGKAARFANSMMQKLADYFEAKLPPSVLNEVQSIGQVMAQHGVKEVPIPTGPDMPSRGPELPTRGPEQIQQRS